MEIVRKKKLTSACNCTFVITCHDDVATKVTWAKILNCSLNTITICIIHAPNNNCSSW